MLNFSYKLLSFYKDNRSNKKYYYININVWVWYLINSNLYLYHKNNIENGYLNNKAIYPINFE